MTGIHHPSESSPGIGAYILLIGDRSNQCQTPFAAFQFGGGPHFRSLVAGFGWESGRSKGLPVQGARVSIASALNAIRCLLPLSNGMASLQRVMVATLEAADRERHEAVFVAEPAAEEPSK